MLNLKSSKHRCECFSQKSGTFLYGLRRDAPSTERVLLERLLNILSRAAAHKSRNPQRLWAQSERPEWWVEVTQLTWKNPRELPKDNKDMLKKKIDVLEKELKKRNLMTKELEEELETHRGSKKIDLELKSDFETIITKASGLHFMLDKVYIKMGQSRIISDKMATYITETKNCIEKIQKRIDEMYEQVQAREERKSDLWAIMGVSKDERSQMVDDLATDSSGFMFDIEESEFPIPGDFDLNEIFSPRPPLSHFSTSSFSATVIHSQPPGELFPSAIPQQTHSPVSPQHSPIDISDDQVPLSVPKSQSHSQSSQTFKSVHGLSVQKSLSQPDSTQAESEEVGVKSESVTSPIAFKRSWGTFADDPEEAEQTMTKSRKIIVIDRGQDEARSWEHIAASPSVASRTMTSSVLGRGAAKDSQGAIERHSIVSKHRWSPRSSTGSMPLSLSEHRPPTHTMSLSRQPSSSPSSYGDQLKLHSTASSSVTPEWLRSMDTIVNTATVTSVSEDRELPTDVTIDAEELENVEAILEDSREKPTVSMYAPDTSGMDQLAYMTKALSFEDLTPSVTESVMIGEISDPHTPLPATLEKGLQKQRRSVVAMETGAEKYYRTLQTAATVGRGVETPFLTPSVQGTVLGRPQHHVTHHRPQTTARYMISEGGNGGRSLSKAIGDLSGDFLH